MEVSKQSNGVKISTGKASVYINPASDIDSGVVIYSVPNTEIDTNDERLIIEGPGEYEFQGIYLKGTLKNGVLSFMISYNDREIFYTNTEGITSIPEDEPFDAVIIETTEGFDVAKIGQVPYPTIYFDKGNILSGNIEAEEARNVNLKKLIPDQKNIFILQ